MSVEYVISFFISKSDGAYTFLTLNFFFIDFCLLSIYSSNSFFDSISPNDFPFIYTLYTSFGVLDTLVNPVVIKSYSIIITSINILSFLFTIIPPYFVVPFLN